VPRRGFGPGGHAPALSTGDADDPGDEWVALVERESRAGSGTDSGADADGGGAGGAGAGADGSSGVTDGGLGPLAVQAALDDHTAVQELAATAGVELSTGPAPDAEWLALTEREAGDQSGEVDAETGERVVTNGDELPDRARVLPEADEYRSDDAGGWAAVRVADDGTRETVAALATGVEAEAVSGDGAGTGGGTGEVAP
jgi:hypothetical protein